MAALHPYAFAALAIAQSTATAAAPAAAAAAAATAATTAATTAASRQRFTALNPDAPRLLGRARRVPIGPPQPTEPQELRRSKSDSSIASVHHHSPALSDTWHTSSPALQPPFQLRSPGHGAVSPMAMLTARVEELKAELAEAKAEGQQRERKWEARYEQMERKWEARYEQMERRWETRYESLLGLVIQQSRG